MSDEITWADYYDENEDREPRELLLEALSRFGPGSLDAVDLGCGSGIDTLAILERGWRVFATDAEAEGIRRLRCRVRDAVRPGGRFGGQILGEWDTWAPDQEISSFSREEARALFDGFEIERFEEEEKDGEACSGPKHWHLFHVLARRSAGPGSDGGP
jgi:hypothetical protein